ncbi:uncharacterized protein LOC110281626 [Arachis duranensis]|uniref:Uncharacterized protein LOC110281626 n=1 Tax=Arachis duranensis TaxID=130453 RepID=A0A6P5NXU2_ARADU|nr:uncharacterized protein LOC110281626 [Arachis duranensis]
MANEEENDRLRREGVILFDSIDVERGLEECRRSLVERLLADRLFTIGIIDPAMTAIWRQPEGMRVIDHGENVFQFFFEKEVPWLFKNYIFNIKRWVPDMDVATEDFSTVPIWIQLWGLPEYCKTKELGKKIGDSMGEVLEVGLFLMRGRETRIVKVRVDLDVTKKLQQVIKIAGPNKKIIEIRLKYERIGSFCFLCVHLGHELRNCSSSLSMENHEGDKEEQWGEWLRADQVGRKIKEMKENPNFNQQKAGWQSNDQRKKPTPVSLLRSLAGLSIEEKENSSQLNQGETLGVILMQSEKEATSDSTKAIENAIITKDTTTIPVAEMRVTQDDEAFNINKIGNKKQKLKHLARKVEPGKCSVVGIKRRSSEIETEAEHEDIKVAETGEGASPQLAPKDQ